MHFNNVIGVPQFSIPKLGYVSDFVQNPPGMYIAIGIGVILILAVFLPDMFDKKKEESERLKAEIERLKTETTAHLSSGELAQIAAEKDKTNE